MIIHNLNIIGSIVPPETNPPLFIDTDAVLTFSVTLECLEAVAWQSSQVFQSLGIVEYPQAFSRLPFNSRKSSNGYFIKKFLSMFALKAFNHTTLPQVSSYAKRNIMPPPT
jgi:hypothetical protein